MMTIHMENQLGEQTDSVAATTTSASAAVAKTNPSGIAIRVRSDFETMFCIQRSYAR